MATNESGFSSDCLGFENLGVIRADWAYLQVHSAQEDTAPTSRSATDDLYEKHKTRRDMP